MFENLNLNLCFKFSFAANVLMVLVQWTKRQRFKPQIRVPKLQFGLHSEINVSSSVC